MRQRLESNRNNDSSAQSRRLIIAEACIAALPTCLGPEIKKRHEGVGYFLGLTDGLSTVVTTVVRPTARTSPGSFRVDIAAIAKVVRFAADAGLFMVGQVHTHPKSAFHSDGDDEGARNAYRGYVSLVVPEYGRHLPSLTDIAAFMFDGSEFVRLAASEISIIGEFYP